MLFAIIMSCISLILLVLLIMRSTEQTSKINPIEIEELNHTGPINKEYDFDAKLNKLVFDLDVSTIVFNLKDYKLRGTAQLDEHVKLYINVTGEYVLDISGCKIPKDATIEFEVSIGKNSTRRYSFGTNKVKNHYTMNMDNYLKLKIWGIRNYTELFQDEIKRLNFVLND